MNEEEFLQQLQEESGVAPDPEAVQQEVTPTPQVRQAPAEIDMSGRGEGMQAFSSQPMTEMPEPPAPTPEYTAVQEELASQEDAEAPLNEGFITDTGKFFLDLFQTPIVPKGSIPGFPDLGWNTPEERDAQMAKQITEKRETEDPTRFIDEVDVALQKGIPAAVAMPLSVAAAVTGQSSDPWSDPPEILKGSPLGQIVFEITQMSMMSATPGAGLLTKGLLAATETATQDSADEVLFGPEMAAKLGELATELTGDEEAGKDVARRLVNGESLESQAYIKTVGFLQNLLGEYVPDILALGFNKNAPAPRHIKDAADALGEDVEKVRASVNNKTTKQADQDFEPSEQMDVDNVNKGVSISDDNTPINEKALIAEAVRLPDPNADAVEVLKLTGGGRKKYDIPPERMPMPEAKLTDAQAEFATNWKAWNKFEEGIQGLRKAAESIGRIGGQKWQKYRINVNASLWLAKNKGLLDVDEAERFIRNFEKDLTVPLPTEMQDDAFRAANNRKLDERLLNKRMVNNEGLVVAAYLSREYGIRIQEAAMQIDNLVNSNVDYTEVAEALDGLINFASLFMMPLRQGKRNWSNAGKVQQNKSLDEVQPLIDKALAAMKGETNVNLKPEEALVGDLISSGGFMKLMQGVRAGKKEYKQLYERLITQLAYSDPETILTELKIFDKTLDEAMKRSMARSFSSLFYAGMLSRAATQAVAFASTLAKLGLQPISTQLSAIRNMGSLEAVEKLAYGQGEFMGGIKGMQDAMDIFRRVYRSNKPINAGDRYKTNAAPGPLLMKRQQDKVVYEAKRRQLDKEGADAGQYAALWMQDRLSALANNPFYNYGPRGLMASDESFKVIRANQIAYGMGNIDALDHMSKGRKKGRPEVYARDYLHKICTKGSKYGEINEATDIGAFALESSQRMTFQRPIPPEGETGLVGDVFAGFEKAADRSVFFKYFNPFIRMGWDATDQALSTLPIFGEAATRLWSKSAKEIIEKGTDANATDAEKARYLELESNFAMAQLVSVTAVGWALSGGITGRTTNGNQPPTSFIVPDPFSDEVYAIDYSRLGPFALWLSLTADTVNTFRTGAMSRHEYYNGMAEITGSLALGTLQQNVLSGITDFSELLNYKNWSPGMIASNLTNLVSGAFPAGGRGLGAVIDPGQKLTTASGPLNIPGNVGRQINQTATGGVGIADQYFPFTGERMFKSPTKRGYNEEAWARVTGFLQELLPVKVVNAAYADHPSIKILNKIGVYYRPADLRQIDGVPLTPPQQSILSQEMDSVGGLNKKLEKWWAGKGGQLWEEYNKLRTEDGVYGTMLQPDNPAARKLQKLRNSYKYDVWEPAMRDTINRGSLRDDEELREGLQRVKDLRASAVPPEAQKQMKGVYQTAAELEAQSQLPTEVQTILDIA